MLAEEGIHTVCVDEMTGIQALARIAPTKPLQPGRPERLFVQSVKNALPNMKFIPAELAGRKVRQLVQQPFTFSITR